VSPHTKAQIGRLVRLVVTTLASSALIVNTVSAWEVRYPLIGVLVGLLEVAWREFMPVVPLPIVTAIPAPPVTDRQPPGPPA